MQILIPSWEFTIKPTIIYHFSSNASSPKNICNQNRIRQNPYIAILINHI
ncbi:hypothetical protein NIES39_L06630 [Arthrospira platensis NIES-39]|nr:hypothetical protein NIES39_L06630 [Arthrospira platensis NIES-39]